MKAAAIKGVKLIETVDIEEPKRNGKTVICEVKKAGICGSDIHNWDGGSPEGLVMGHEFSGVVIDPGDRTDLKLGDRVTALPISPCGKCPACKSGNPQYCLETWSDALGLALTNPGAYAPRTGVRSDMVIKLPNNVNDDEAAMVEPAAVGLHAIHLADIKVGAKVLVIGGGIIGLVSAMFAKMEGASYVAVSETNEGRGAKAVKLGVADEFFNPTKEDFMEKIMEKTGLGFDYVIECCGNDAAVTSAIMTCRPGGKVVLVGVAPAPISIPTVVGVLHEIELQGAIAYTHEEFQTVIDLIAAKKIDVMKFVDKVVGIRDVQDAFVELTSGESDSVKILIDPNK